MRPCLSQQSCCQLAWTSGSMNNPAEKKKKNLKVPFCVMERCVSKYVEWIAKKEEERLAKDSKEGVNSIVEVEANRDKKGTLDKKGNN